MNSIVWVIERDLKYYWETRRITVCERAICFDYDDCLLEESFYIFLICTILSGQSHRPPYYNRVFIATARPSELVEEMNKKILSFKRSILYVSIAPDYKNIIDNFLTFKESSNIQLFDTDKYEMNPYTIQIIKSKGVARYYIDERATPYDWNYSKSAFIDKIKN